jgi:hypothetical protein
MRRLKQFVLAFFLIHATQTSAITGSASWDIDKDGRVDALTDALLLLRHLFDVSGSSLTDGAVSPSSILDHDGILSSLDDTMAIADIDGSGHVDALTDALILLRYLFDVSGDLLIDSAIYPTATRSSYSNIASYIESKIPSMASMNEEYLADIVGSWASDYAWFVFSRGGNVTIWRNGVPGDDLNCFGNYSQLGNIVTANLNCNDENENESKKTLSLELSPDKDILEVLSHDELFEFYFDDLPEVKKVDLEMSDMEIVQANIVPGIYDIEGEDGIFIEVTSTGEIRNIQTPLFPKNSQDEQYCSISAVIEAPIFGVTVTDDAFEPSISAHDGILSVNNCKDWLNGSIDSFTSTEAIFDSNYYYYDDVHYIDIAANGFFTYGTLVCDGDNKPATFALGEYSKSICDSFYSEYKSLTSDDLIGYWKHSEVDVNLRMTRDGNAFFEAEGDSCFGQYSISDISVRLSLDCDDGHTSILEFVITTQGELHFLNDETPGLIRFNSELLDSYHTVEISPISSGTYLIWDYDVFLEINDDGEINTQETHESYDEGSSCNITGQIFMNNNMDGSIDGNYIALDCLDGYSQTQGLAIATGFNYIREDSIYSTEVSIVSADENLDLILVCDIDDNPTEFAWSSGHHRMCHNF